MGVVIHEVLPAVAMIWPQGYIKGRKSFLAPGYLSFHRLVLPFCQIYNDIKDFDLELHLRLKPVKSAFHKNTALL